MKEKKKTVRISSNWKNIWIFPSRCKIQKKKMKLKGKKRRRIEIVFLLNQ